jgi:hypothetical protein
MKILRLNKIPIIAEETRRALEHPSNSPSPPLSFKPCGGEKIPSNWELRLRFECPTFPVRIMGTFLHVIMCEQVRNLPTEPLKYRDRRGVFH